MIGPRPTSDVRMSRRATPAAAMASRTAVIVAAAASRASVAVGRVMATPSGPSRRRARPSPARCPGATIVGGSTSSCPLLCRAATSMAGTSIVAEPSAAGPSPVNSVSRVHGAPGIPTRVCNPHPATTSGPSRAGGNDPPWRRDQGSGTPGAPVGPAADVGFGDWIGRGAALAIGVALVVGAPRVRLGRRARPRPGVRRGDPRLRPAADHRVAAEPPPDRPRRGDPPRLRRLPADRRSGCVVFVLPSAIGQFQSDPRGPAAVLRSGAGSGPRDLQPAPLARSLIAVIDAAARIFRPGRARSRGEEVVEVGVTVAGAIMSVLTLLTVVYFWLTEHARLQRYVLAFVPQHRRARARDIWNQTENAPRHVGPRPADPHGGDRHRDRGRLRLARACRRRSCSGSSPRSPRRSRSSARCSARSRPSSSPPRSRRSSPSSSPASTLVLQFIEGNILVPIVMRNTVGISPFLVILSVLVGGDGRRLRRGAARRADRGDRRDPARGPPGARGPGCPGPDDDVGVGTRMPDTSLERPNRRRSRTTRSGALPAVAEPD